MGNEKETRRHINCSFMREIRKGVYCCCDSRSLIQGKELNKNEAMQEGCSFWHPPKETEELTRLGNIKEKQHGP